MDIATWMSQNINLDNPKVLEVYQGYLVAGKRNRKSICFWLNKQNIEGLTEVAKVIAIESSFHGLLSLIPGGSFAYRLIKDQIGYPPRHNIIFDPELYEVSFQTITLDKKGEPKTIVDNLSQGVENVAKTAAKTGEKIQKSLVGFITKQKPDPVSSFNDQEDILGFTYIRFIDAVSSKRNQIIKKRIKSSESRSGKIVKQVVTELVPAIIISFKTTENEKSQEFLENLRSLGFNVSFSDSIFEENEN